MNAKKTLTRLHPQFARELAARGCEASLLAAVIAAQHAGLDDLFDDLARLYRRAGDARRAIEAGAVRGDAA